jgi:hypothetical protein
VEYDVSPPDRARGSFDSFMELGCALLASLFLGPVSDSVCTCIAQGGGEGRKGLKSGKALEMSMAY